MGELLGIGLSHAPMFQFPDENMADILRSFLKRESIPAEVRDTLYKQIKENYEGGTGATRAEDKKALEKLQQRGYVLQKFSPEGQQEYTKLSQTIREHLTGRVFSKDLLDRVTKIARGG